MKELKHGKTYIGNTFNMNYIGTYNKDTDSLDKVYGISIKQTGEKSANIDIIPPVHPVFLIPKIEQNKLNDVSIKCNMFLQIVDPDSIRDGDYLVNNYKQIATGIILDTTPEEKVMEGKCQTNEEIAEKLKKAVNNNDKKESNLILK